VIPFPLENKAKDNKPTERMAATRELYLRPREHNTERGGYLEGIDQNRASFVEAASKEERVGRNSGSIIRVFSLFLSPYHVKLQNLLCFS
jgi:hypothetical protein